jgi:uroporphyrinogen decarboxylase
MTRRERVLAAIAHQEPDRVPVDLGGMRSTGITAIAYSRLKRHLGLRTGETFVYDVVQQLAQPEPGILEFAGTDVVDLGRAWLRDPGEWKDWTLPDGSPAKIPGYVDLVPDGAGGWLARAADGAAIGVMPAGAFYLSQNVFPLLDWNGDPAALECLPALMAKVTWSALPTAPFHKPLTAEHLADVRLKARELYETTDYAVMVGFGGNLLEWGEYLCRFDQFLIDLAESRPKAESLLDKLVEMHLGNLDKVLDAVEGYVQVIQMGDDLGAQRATVISPRLYREVFKPRQQVLFERVRRRRGLHLFLHSCGSIVDIIPDLIESGVEILNPVQTSARGMDPAFLKREFGKDLTFWGGGCDTQRILPEATPDEVRRHVKERVSTFASGGGFVFCQVHNILPNVPPENVAAMYDAVRSSGSPTRTRSASS